jgi:predicted lipoprotein with Yx(FWY)xxD motif
MHASGLLASCLTYRMARLGNTVVFSPQPLRCGFLSPGQDPRQNAMRFETCKRTAKGISHARCDVKGMTLYYRTTDRPPTTVCSGGCASAWPSMLVSGSSAPTSTVSLPGKMSVQADANGIQVEYNGHPLYTFSGESAPGQTTGDGFGGIWLVVTPSLT